MALRLNKPLAPRIAAPHVKAPASMAAPGEKRKVKKPGSRGAAYWIDGDGNVRYDDPPAGVQARTGKPPRAEGLPDYAPIGSTALQAEDLPAAEAKLEHNTALDPIRLGLTPELWRETQLNRQGVIDPIARAQPPILPGQARTMSVVAADAPVYRPIQTVKGDNSKVVAKAMMAA